LVVRVEGGSYGEIWG